MTSHVLYGRRHRDSALVPSRVSGKCAFAALATKPSDNAYGCVANEKRAVDVREHGNLGATFRIVACFSMFAVRPSLMRPAPSRRVSRHCACTYDYLTVATFAPWYMNIGRLEQQGKNRQLAHEDKVQQLMQGLTSLCLHPVSCSTRMECRILPSQRRWSRLKSFRLSLNDCHTKVDMRACIHQKPTKCASTMTGIRRIRRSAAMTWRSALLHSRSSSWPRTKRLRSSRRRRRAVFFFSPATRVAEDGFGAVPYTGRVAVA